MPQKYSLFWVIVIWCPLCMYPWHSKIYEWHMMIKVFFISQQHIYFSLFCSLKVIKSLFFFIYTTYHLSVLLLAFLSRANIDVIDLGIGFLWQTCFTNSNIVLRPWLSMPVMENGNWQPVIFFFSSRACYFQKQLIFSVLSWQIKSKKSTISRNNKF